MVAENQALGVLADGPVSRRAGGCFVSGGSAGNLSALIVARDTAAPVGGGRAGASAHRDQRRGPLVGGQGTARPRRGRAHGGDQGPPFDRTRTGGGAPRRPAARERHRGRGHRRHHERRHRRRPEESPTLRPNTRCGSTSTGPTAAGRPLRTLGATRISPASTGPTRSSSTRTSGCLRPSTAQPCLPPAQPRQGRAHPGRQYLEVLHSGNPEEWNPSDYAFHLTRRARGLPLWFSMAVNGLDAYCDAVEAGLRSPSTRRTDREGTARRVGPRRRGSPSCSSGGRAGPSWTTTPGPPACCRPDRLRHPDDVGRRDGRPFRLPPSQHDGGDIDEILASMAEA